MATIPRVAGIQGYIGNCNNITCRLRRHTRGYKAHVGQSGGATLSSHLLGVLPWALALRQRSGYPRRWRCGGIGYHEMQVGPIDKTGSASVCGYRQCTDGRTLGNPQHSNNLEMWTSPGGQDAYWQFGGTGWQIFHHDSQEHQIKIYQAEWKRDLG